MKAQDIFDQANSGIIGINDELEVFGGYDDRFKQADAESERPEFLSPEEWDEMPSEEKLTLADHMIALWFRYKNTVLKKASEQVTE